MMKMNDWCCINSGLPPEFNMNAFDIENPEFREMFREKNKLHTYENLNKSAGWVCAKGDFRGRGKTIRQAEMDLIIKLYLEANHV